MAKPITVKCFLTSSRNESIEIRKYLYTNSADPTVTQMKDDVKLLYPQLRGERFELMYLDDDNNKIAVSSDAELRLGWREMKMNVSNNQQFRLYIYT